MPLVVQRALPKLLGVTSACTSTRSGRVPFHADYDSRASGIGCRSARKIAEGLVTSNKSLAMHLEDADLVRRAKAIFDAA